jgi:hypothetical protein
MDEQRGLSRRGKVFLALFDKLLRSIVSEVEQPASVPSFVILRRRRKICFSAAATATGKVY